tara:strand:- start:2128 stop:2748 length:621 start_codon:yes stop_codon:yes gene_type:complete
MNESIVKYWGHYDSSVIFCEDKYAHSPYIAEFYNTISGLSYVLVGLYYFNTSIYRTAITQILLGAGTMMLHGTLRWYGQIADELSMVTMMFMYIKEVQNISYNWLVLLYVLYITVYDLHAIFSLIFGVLIVYQYLLANFLAKSSGSQQKVNYYKYSMILGMICLAIDHIFCIKSPNFHALWHLFTACGAYFGSSFYVEYKNLITNI